MSADVTAGDRLRLKGFGVEALEAMYLRDAGLFPFTVRLGAHGPDPVGASIRYTAIALLGLRAAGRAGFPTGLDLDEILQRLAERLDRIANIGDVGLLMWADAAGSARHVEAVLRRVEQHGEFSRTPGCGIYASMELAWLVIGLLALRSVRPDASRVDSLLERAYRDLAANYNPRSGLFRFARRGGQPPKRLDLKRDLCFFAEQIYGVEALARYAERTCAREPLAWASRTVARLRSAQGPQGQWAWSYDAGSGDVLDRYPVYSVHQHGMAPMSLACFSAVSGEDCSVPISRGFTWVAGKNELQTSLIDWEHRVIWRSIRRRGVWREVAKIQKALGLLGVRLPRRLVEHAPRVSIDHECRPYELGWMLVASCGTVV